MKKMLSRVVLIFTLLLVITAGVNTMFSREINAEIGDEHVLEKSPGPFVLDNGQIIYCLDAYQGSPAVGTTMVETAFPDEGMMTGTSVEMSLEHVRVLETMMALQHPSLTSEQMEKLFPDLPAMYNTADKGSVALSNTYVQQMNLWIWQNNVIAWDSATIESAISTFARVYKDVVDITTEDWTNYFYQMDSYSTDVLNGKDVLDASVTINSNNAKVNTFGSDQVMGPYVINVTGDGIINDIVASYLDTPGVVYVDKDNKVIDEETALYNGAEFYVKIPAGSSTVDFGITAQKPEKTDMTLYVPEGFSVPTTWQEWSDIYQNAKSGQPMASFAPKYTEIKVTESVTTTSVELTAQKKVEGAILNANQFRFEVQDLDNNKNVVATGTNDAAGDIDFSTIYYDISAVGVHHYQIVEVIKKADGWTNDTNAYLVDVEVVDNGDGTLSATASYPNGDIVFTNTYAPDEPKNPGEEENIEELPNTGNNSLFIVSILGCITLGTSLITRKRFQ